MAERGSTEHSPRVDDALEQEVEPVPNTSLSVNDIELRSLVARSLRPSAFPGNRAGLLAVAREENAEPLVVALLQDLPETSRFENLQSVWEAIGGGHETRDDPTLEHHGAEPQDSRPVAPGPVCPSAPSGADSAGPAIVTRVAGLAATGVGLVASVVLAAARAVRRAVPSR